MKFQALTRRLEASAVGSTCLLVLISLVCLSANPSSQATHSPQEAAPADQRRPAGERVIAKCASSWSSRPGGPHKRQVDCVELLQGRPTTNSSLPPLPSSADRANSKNNTSASSTAKPRPAGALRAPLVLEPTAASTTASPRAIFATTTPGQPSRLGLITRTSDAIYKTLTGYFRHEAEDEEEEGPSAVATTTALPAAATTTTRPSTTPSTSTTTSRATSEAPRRSTTRADPPRSSTPISSRSKLTSPPHLDLSRFHDAHEQVSSTTAAGSGSATSTTARPSPPTSLKSFSKPTTSSTTPAPTSTARARTTSERPASSTEVIEPPRGENPGSAKAQANVSALTIAPNSRQPGRQNSTELFSFLNRALNSIYWMGDFGYFKNRTARAPASNSEPGEREFDDSADELATSTPRPAASDRLVLVEAEKPAGAARRPRQQVVSGANSSSSVATREDILLLCKLLHKHLESGRQNENGSITLTLDGPLAANLSSPAEPTRAPPTRHHDEKPPDSLAAGSTRLVGDPQLELGELQHEDRLLESTFALLPVGENKRREGGGANRSHEQAAEALLHDLYNLGHKRKLREANRTTTSGSTAQPLEEESAPLDELASTHLLQAPTSGNISLRVWARTTTGAGGRGGGRLKLVYWLLERVRVSRGGGGSDSSRAKYKVLDFQAAGELLDELDHGLVQQLVDELAIVRPIVLLAPHKLAKKESGGPTDELGLPTPNVIDDTLSSPAGGPGSSSATGGGGGPTTGGGEREAASRSALQLLVDRLAQSSFSDNLYLYLVLFIVLLFVLIMCFAVPALCCKCMMPASGAGELRGTFLDSRARQSLGGGNVHRTRGGNRTNGRGRGAHHNGRREQQPEPAYDQDLRASHTTPPNGKGSHLYRSTDPLRESISSISGALAAGSGATGKQAADGAIWRKLSNSTTTLTRDQVRSMEDEGQLGVPIGRGELGSAAAAGQALATTNKNGSKFEWYTFEDRQTVRKTTSTSDKPTQTLVMRDERKVTKSVQTSSSSHYSDDLLDRGDYRSSNGNHQAGQPEPSGHFVDSIDREQLSLAYRDRLEARNSDTLTKSELVMLKEKLIPIGREVRAQQQQTRRDQQQVDLQQSHDYVNTASQRTPTQHQQRAVVAPTRHIDSSVESGNGGPPQQQQQQQLRPRPEQADANQRAPSMRYLDLPAGTQAKVEAIRSELERVEARDAALGRTSSPSCQERRVPAGKLSDQTSGGVASAGTYKRFDVI